MPEVKPCQCGSDDIIKWLACDNDPFDLTALEKIECRDCGRVVWGGGAEEIEKWNKGDCDD